MSDEQQMYQGASWMYDAKKEDYQTGNHGNSHHDNNKNSRNKIIQKKYVTFKNYKGQ